MVYLGGKDTGWSPYPRFRSSPVTYSPPLTSLSLQGGTRIGLTGGSM